MMGNSKMNLSESGCEVGAGAEYVSTGCLSNAGNGRAMAQAVSR
jgi:hypothetical protein